ncbi:hypothetical protein PG291_02290 [Riemerella anatipestifer]|nr:hypothetical protein [Riemerella anatipestifer]
MKQRQEAKKRLMFIQKEDYNFLTYNLLILLKTLQANSKESRFHDFRKIAYLIHFISTEPNFNDLPKQELAIIYTKSHLKKQLLSHLVLILKNRNYLGVEVNSVRRTLDIWIKEENISSDFFSGNLFEKEVRNAVDIKKSLPRLKILTLKNVVDSIFTKNNIITWEV